MTADMFRSCSRLVNWYATRSNARPVNLMKGGASQLLVHMPATNGKVELALQASTQQIDELEDSSIDHIPDQSLQGFIVDASNQIPQLKKVFTWLATRRVSIGRQEFSGH
jgi:hypothetical protein